MQAILTSLLDIGGVVGSFALRSDGSLLAREMPSVYPDELFPEIGRRLAGVSEALDLQMRPFQDLLLKFEGYSVFVRRTGNLFLSILAEESVNLPALKMASNVALRRLDERASANPEPAPAALRAPASEPRPKASDAPVPIKHSRRIWRGQVVE